MIRYILTCIKQNNIRFRAFFTAALIIYLIYLTYLTFFSHLYGRTISHRSINLIPFRTIIHYMMTSNSARIVLINIAGNIVAFMPMGFLLPMLSKKLKRFLRVLVIALLASATIETMQYVAGVGVSDIDDIVLNLLGGIFGYILNRVIIKAITHLG